MSAAACLRNEGFRYALDNGAWSAFTQGRPFDVPAFERALRKMGGNADWTVLPDIVAGGPPSLDLSLKWMRRVLDETPVALLAVQNGITPNDVRGFLGPRVGLFVGGDTKWKLDTMAAWGALGREVGCWVHVGRVNSARRILHCSSVGAHSFDGTSVSRYSVSLRRLENARQQQPLFFADGSLSAMSSDPSATYAFSPRPAMIEMPKPPPKNDVIVERLRHGLLRMTITPRGNP